MKDVVTWSAPNGATKDICAECEDAQREQGTWPRTWQGEEYCSVSMGTHEGVCDLCELEFGDDETD